MDKPPEYVYIQHGEPYDPYAENTWNPDPVGEDDCDTKYIRCDLYREAQLRELAALGQAQEHYEALQTARNDALREVAEVVSEYEIERFGPNEAMEIALVILSLVKEPEA